MPTREDLLAKARADAGYRRQLLADPRGTLSEALGRELPGHIDVEVLQERPDHIYLVVPASAPPTAGDPGDKELTDAELSMVAAAGGCFLASACACHSGISASCFFAQAQA